MFEDSAEILVYLAAASYMIGYVIINQIILRLMVTVGVIFYIWYYLVALSDPRDAVIATLLTGGANLIGIFQILIKRSEFIIPQKDRGLYEMFNLPPGDFRSLMKIAERQTLEEDFEATTLKTHPEKLYFIVSGSAKVEKAGQVFDLPHGLFVGEVAYLKNQTSSATCVIRKGSEVISWRFSELKNKKRRAQSARVALEAAISRDLATKVQEAVRIPATQ